MVEISLFAHAYAVFLRIVVPIVSNLNIFLFTFTKIAYAS